MECRGIEVRSAWPNDRMNFRIERGLGKDPRVTEGAIKFTLKHGFEINRSGQAVVEAQAQRVWRDEFEGSDAVNGMFHGANLLQRHDRGWFAAFLKKLPVGTKLILMKLRPCLDETLLALRNESDDESHG